MNDFDLEPLFRKADERVRAPLGFEERLFARLEHEVRPAYVPAREAMPWWVRLAAERHVAFAFLLAGLVLASPAWLLSSVGPARASIVALGHIAESALAPWLAPLAGTPNAGLALALALSPFLAWGSYRLALAVERRTARAAFASIRG